VLASLALPTEYAVTDAARLGTAAMLEMLERRLARGLKLVQLREPQLSAEQRSAFCDQAIVRAHRYGCKVMVKSPHPGADGIHFTAAELMQLKRKPATGLVAASCHTREELAHAMQLELDFAVLGPVKDKADAMPLGWERFAAMAHGTMIPVYAIGGLVPADMEQAWRAGAHGVAMIRGAWS
jgi:8-oxo-dGTP diphosphatase